jgi:hypothetical protein
MLNHLAAEVQYDSITVGVSVDYNFQTGSNKIKLLTEYDSVTRQVLFDIMFNLLSYTIIFCYFLFENNRPQKPRQ